MTAAEQLMVKLGPWKPGTYQDRDGIWIVVGSDAPGNDTGKREVHHFASLAEAHEAGFLWAM